MTDTINAIVVPGGFDLPLWTAQKQGFFGDAVPEAFEERSPRVKRRYPSGVRQHQQTAAQLGFSRETPR